MKTEIDLVEIGIGNIGSVKRCLNRLGVNYRTANQDNPPDGTRPMILPGVGNFAAVMQALRQNQFDSKLCQLIQQGTPYLGICVGLQILFQDSEESPGVPGLSLLNGQVVRFKQGKVPHVGWNLIQPTTEKNIIGGHVYFVNSYYAQPQSMDVTSHTANYYGSFCAALKIKNITATQFHPERSGELGSQFLQEWILND
jgi:imidazole glycerol phosphate synthase glutamine amidotransferase subunit